MCAAKPRAGDPPLDGGRHRPRRRFGQHFLHDAGVIDKILAAVAPAAGQPLVEIGPGLGALSCALLPRLGVMDAVELDRDLIPLLRERTAGLGQLRVHQADAVKFDFCALASRGRKLRVVGNLPYNISTPLLFHLLEQQACIVDMHFMVQKEVARRLAAAPGDRCYGRLGIMVQYRCIVESLFDVGAGAFSPPPRVASSFVRLVPRGKPLAPVRNEARFRQLVTQAFSQRRKTLRNALKGLLTRDELLAQGVDPLARPETLPIETYAMLSNCME